ncbi:MAG: transposase [Proteobacteria bacterium]|nr:transposase [Desulfobacteraceae bacterium]MBU4012269.1 transposase [Pseudomonadota bacterium]MBU4067810.1 transposase [Pseudomonadota bacterium]MBU4101617.1 transposase [Pseudomonadota bacterium]
MEMASIINQYYNAFIAKYTQTSLPGHLKAMNAIRSCRTPDSGELYVQCPDCSHAEWRPLSCGHRSCPKCQNHEASQWIDRQQSKLLPVLYFMATFTLAYELRSLVWRHQKDMYSILLTCVSSTLKDFGLNPKNLGAEIGMTMVLHTHNRRLDFHPHIHVIVPGGGVDKRRRQWKKKKGKYLFNRKAMAKVFRARFLTALNEAGFSIPKRVPEEWVVDCTCVGKGITALKYLSRYLYRGVISEKNIVSNQNGQVTFKYIESKTGNTLYRILKGEDFLHLILQHVLPKGFRRVRDYGFLHSNAKKLLSLVQLILHVVIKGIKQRPRPVFKCPRCQSPMVILGFRRPVWESG